MEQVYANGGRVVGGDYQVVGRESAQSPSGDWAITTHTKIGRQKVVGAGDLNQRYPAGKGKSLLAITRLRAAGASRRWRVCETVRLDVCGVTILVGPMDSRLPMTTWTCRAATAASERQPSKALKAARPLNAGE